MGEKENNQNGDNFIKVNGCLNSNHQIHISHRAHVLEMQQNRKSIIEGQTCPYIINKYNLFMF